MLFCPICDAGIKNNDFIRIYFSNHTEYKLYHCSNCHIEFWSPMKIIKEAYIDEVFDNYIALHLGLRDLPNRTVPFFKKFPLKKGRLIDLGCGEGAFLARAERLGFEVWGTDFDIKSIKVAKERGLENTFAMSIEEFVKYAQTRRLKFDIVTFFEVLEHLDEPKKVIEHVKKILKQGGYIAGSIPNRERFLADLSRRVLLKDFPPHHFTWWSKDALTYFLNSNGFVNVEIYLGGKWSLMETSALWESVLLGRLTNPIKKFIKKYIVKNLAWSTLNLEEIKNLQDYDYNSLGFKIASSIRQLRNMIFLPLALGIEMAGKGYRIYFQAKLP